jgi:hypothetical protein
VKVRVTSVENGRKFQNSKRGEATMPDGAAIFETSGALAHGNLCSGPLDVH